MAKNPEEQNIRSRARRRLIGAIALSLAVVVILPMVLDSEPKSTGQDIDLRIPSPDKAGEFVPGTALSEAVSAAQQAETAAASAASVAAEPATVEPATDEIAKFADATPEARPQAAKPADVRQPEPKKIEVKNVSKADAKPVEAKPVEAKPAEVKKHETKNAEARQAEVKQAEAKPQSDNTYIVQVGAFSNAGTATEQADTLKGWGFKAYTEFISGTTRVRVGPYTDRSKADEVRALLEKRGLHPVVSAVKP